MDEGFNLDREQARALLLQRTAYQPVWTPLVHKVGLSGWYANSVATRSTKVGRTSLGRRYRDESEAEAESILRHLPPATGRLMDIGCGLAGPDLVLARHLPNLQITLIDMDRFDEVPFYGFHSSAAAYNSLSSTKQFLVQNGLNAEKIRTVDILREPFPATVQPDVVISIISWGFHYPVSTYLDDVHEALVPGGVAILDIRNGTDGVAALRRRFHVEQIDGPSRGKSHRYLATKVT